MSCPHFAIKMYIIMFNKHNKINSLFIKYLFGVIHWNESQISTRHLDFQKYGHKSKWFAVLTIKNVKSLFYSRSKDKRESTWKTNSGNWTSRTYERLLNYKTNKRAHWLSKYHKQQEMEIKYSNCFKWKITFL